MKNLYEKRPLSFALIWIGVYCALSSLANPLSRLMGVDYAAHALFNLGLAVVLFLWIKKRGLMERYGLCAPSVPARAFLWYLPLVLLASYNLWNGVAVNLSPAGTLCYLCCMFCVGFVEEIIFRGLLFRAIARDNIKLAVILSSVTFGLGHLLNLVNGSGMELAANLCQVAGAIGAGFLFVTIYYKSGSVVPCILTHSAINMVSAFANEAGLTDEKRILFSITQLGITVLYTLILTKTLPRPQPAAQAIPGQKQG